MIDTVDVGIFRSGPNKATLDVPWNFIGLSMMYDCDLAENEHRIQEKIKNE
jgi:hypothetical protein